MLFKHNDVFQTQELITILFKHTSIKDSAFHTHQLIATMLFEHTSL
jgi:hypothetical protein